METLRGGSLASELPPGMSKAPAITQPLASKGRGFAFIMTDVLGCWMFSSDPDSSGAECFDGQAD
jgi:hypothetical protein